MVVRSGGRAKFSIPKGNEVAALGDGIETVSEGVTSEDAQEFSLTSQEMPTQTPSVSLTDSQFTPITPLRSSVTTASYVRALEKAYSFGKNKLSIEIAVALAFFASSATGACKPTKRDVMGIYEQAGYKVTPTGEDYKTVSRRINASASLFEKIGKGVVESAMQGLTQGKAIESLANHITEVYGFNGINSVLEYVGKTVKQTNTPEYIASRALDDVAASTSIVERMQESRKNRTQVVVEDNDGTIVSAGALSFILPRDASVQDIRAMAAKLTDFADRLEAEIGTPEEQRNREMHS